MKVSRHVKSFLYVLLLGSFFYGSVGYAGPVKIFILAGQSNMVGHGQISPVETMGTLEHIAANDSYYSFLQDAGGNWAIRDDVWIKDQNASYGGLTVSYGAQTSKIGPELGFGHFVGDLYEKRVLLVKAAWGGKSLAVDFRPPSSGGTTGFYYNQLLGLIDDAVANLTTYVPGYDPNDGYEFAGFGWHQGWNDRVSSTYSAEYETNMANFIKDIRTYLDVLDMPFVIATTGMDGTASYTVVEQAQLAMADPNAHPEFIGNVAVVDTRINYENLEFWQPAEYSPTSQGYHWNQNAKTYTNIGLAMGDAMSTMSLSRCPSRLRAVGAAGGGVNLTWQNGSEIPISVQVLRNSVEIAAAAPVTPASFLDAAAQPGIINYELVFTMPGDSCGSLTRTFNGGITDLLAFRSPGGIDLTWVNNMSYDAIEIRRDGNIIAASHDGSSQTFTDTSPPASGIVTYSVVPTNGTAVPTETQINLDGLPAGTAVIYEPFDYEVGGLNLQSGVSEVGLEGVWSANSTTLVTAGSMAYDVLPVGGGKLSDFTASQNRWGGVRTIRTAALAGNGLLDDGATLWISAIMGIQDGANRTNSDLSLALASDAFVNTNYSFLISNNGNGVGIKMGAGKPQAAFFPGSDSGGNVVTGTFTGHQFNVPEHGLIVAKITWGATEDIIELYQPGTDLALPASPISTLTANVDQSTFDTLTFRRSDKPILDEIRFGEDYDDVIGAGDPTLPSVEAGPDMITWAGEPVPLDPNVVNNYGSDLTYHWSADPSVGVVFSPDTGDPAPTVTVNNAPTSNPSVVTVTLAVNNVGRTVPDVEDTLQIDVYDDACKAAIAGGTGDHPADIVGDDCTINMADLVELSKTWLNSKALPVPEKK